MVSIFQPEKGCSSGEYKYRRDLVMNSLPPPSNLCDSHFFIALKPGFPRFRTFKPKRGISRPLPVGKCWALATKEASTKLVVLESFR